MKNAPFWGIFLIPEVCGALGSAALFCYNTRQYEKGEMKMEILLRPWRMEDAGEIWHYANNRKVAENLRDVFPFPYAEQDAADFIESCIKGEGKGQLCRAICVDGKPVGSIAVCLGQDVYRRSAELGYWLAEPFWGKGIMSQAVAQICREAFERFDIVRIYAEPYAHNQESRRVLEKAGFVLEGILRQSVYKNGQMHDSCIYALVK